MTKLKVILLFVVYLKTDSIAACPRRADADTARQAHARDKILKIVEHLFISLKVSKSFTISKYTEEYMSRHSLIQNAICSDHKIYKSVHDISKTKISNKIAFYILNINKAIEEMISEVVKNVRDDTELYTRTSDDEKANGFVNLARRLNLKLETIAPISSVPKLNASKGNDQEEGRRIFAGSSAGIAKYPFMGSVHVAGRFVCAGSLLTDSLALSAASCLMRTVETKPHIQIRVASDYVSKMGSLVNVEELIFHPEFDRASLENNLVLLRVRKALRFRPQLVMAVRYDRADGSALPAPGAGAGAGELVLLGWGKRRTDGSDVRDEDRPLSEGRLQLYDFAACQYIYTREFVTNKSFCAGFVDRGAGACNHDAGGPALVGDTLVGVISFGSAHCGAADAPTVLTHIAPHAPWIDAVLRGRAQNQENKSEKQINDSIQGREEANLDQAVRDVYRDNFNVDEVLYGPIDPYDGEMGTMSTVPLLRDFPTDPNMFPNPQLVSNVPSAEPLRLVAAEPPPGYWRDSSSIEQTNKETNEDYKTPANQFDRDSSTLQYSSSYHTTDQASTDMVDSIYGPLDIYADKDETTSTTEELVSAKETTEIKVTPQTYEPEDALYVEAGPQKTSKVSILRDENLYSTGPSSVPYDGPHSTRLSPLAPENAGAYEPDQRKQSGTSKAENAEANEKAVIVLADSGTTQIIQLNKNDPFYEGGFKRLAAQIIRSKNKVVN